MTMSLRQHLRESHPDLRIPRANADAIRAHGDEHRSGKLSHYHRGLADNPPGWETGEGVGLTVDYATMPAWDPIEFLTDEEVDVVRAWQDLELVRNHTIPESWVRKRKPEWLADRTYEEWVAEKVASSTENLRVVTDELRRAEGDAKVAETLRWAAERARATEHP